MTPPAEEERPGAERHFSLLGGPLHGLGRRLGLVRHHTDTWPLGIAIGVTLWLSLAIAALIDGVLPQLFTLSVIGAHVRLLVVVPLFFVCESWVDPRMHTFVAMIAHSEIVDPESLPVFRRDIGRVRQWTESWISDALCLIVAVSLSWSGIRLISYGATGAFDPGRAVEGAHVVAEWYWFVCLPIVRFLIARWLLRLALWSWFLWRVSHLHLHLLPTHPDGAAGLGYLEVVHAHFIPLIFAISAIEASALVEDLAAGRATVNDVYALLAIALGVDTIVFLGPLCIFSKQMWRCRVRGLSEYMDLAERYVRTFDVKWLRGGAPTDEPLLGSADVQSLADLAGSVELVKAMRFAPISLRLITQMTVAAALPTLPLLLFKYPLSELIQKFFERLAGV